MAANSPDNSPIVAIRKRKGIILALLLGTGFVYVAVPQLGFFDANWNTLLHSDLRFLAISVLALLASFGAASFIYHQLSPKKLQFSQTYVVQIASAFAGKVLPAGLGSISINYLYLRRQGCRQAVAGTVVAVNNLLGFIGHGLWLILVSIVLSDQLASLHVGDSSGKWGLWLLAGTILLLAGLFFAARSRMQKAARDIGTQLRMYRQRPRKVVAALLASMVLTACNILIVWFAAQALDLPLTIAASAIALTTGVLAQTVTPTPGGLGGVEAGLVGGLTLSGLGVQDAVAVTILFRFVTYWLPLLLGGLALVFAVRKKLL